MEDQARKLILIAISNVKCDMTLSPSLCRAQLGSTRCASPAAQLEHHGHPMERARSQERPRHRKHLKTCILFSFQSGFIESFPFQGYKVYYTTNPHLAMSRWESQFVDNNKLTTISDLTPHTIYTIRVEAYTAIGPGPPSAPVQVYLKYM